ncbi:phage major capsid protein [Gordonia insulae]|uniref:Phage capsid-like C-terminal domain-containing protein n=1 Tax=Gordonia insulae TaxID=2420509 RepID=A0A3G8JJZ3_9ACTN|nr:phage major capsid protein [Gordonia insulae]AZG44819.1 hypothetical protein D7316_01410 [Gordonia insulae]
MPSNVFSTPDAVKALAMDVKGVAPKDIIPEALIIQATTKAGNVEGDAPAVLVPYVSFDPDDIPFVPEGNVIPELEPDDAQAVIHTSKVGLIVPISVEQYGQDDAAALISDAAREALVRKANRAFLAQAAPVAPAINPPAGLLHQPLTEIDGDIITAGNLDALVDAIATIEADGGKASQILANPLAWAQVSKLKLGGESQAPLLGNAAQAQPQRQLLNVPVVVDRDVPADRLVVLDKQGVISAYGQVLVATSKEYLWNQQSVALMVTFRFGAVVAKPNRVVTVALEA